MDVSILEAFLSAEILSSFSDICCGKLKTFHEVGKT
jgi:hypothetical protein